MGQSYYLLDEQTMSERVDLKEIERKSYLSYHQDGLAEICLGIPLILFGLLFHPLIAGYVPGVAMSQIVWFVFIYAALKRAITIPRIGYVEFLPRRRTRFALLILILVLITFVPLLLVFLLTAGQQIVPAMSDVMIFYLLIICGLFGSGILTLIGLFTEIRRFYGYAIITLILFIIGFFLVLPFALPVIGIGIIITITGFVKLTQFLRKYPKSTEEHISVEEWQEE